MSGKVINPLTNRKVKVGGALHKKLCKDVKVNIAGCPERKAPRGGAKKSMRAPGKISKKEQEEIDDLNEFFDSMFGSDRRYQKSKKQMQQQRAKAKPQEEKTMKLFQKISKKEQDEINDYVNELFERKSKMTKEEAKKDEKNIQKVIIQYGKDLEEAKKFKKDYPYNNNLTESQISKMKKIFKKLDSKFESRLGMPGYSTWKKIEKIYPEAFNMTLSYKMRLEEIEKRARIDRERAKVKPQEEKKHEEVKVKPKEKKTIKIRIKKTPVPKKKAPEIKHEKKGDKLKFITVEYNQCYNVDVVGKGGRSKTSQSKTFKVNFYKGISTSGKDELRAENYTLYKGYPSLSQTFDELESLNVNAKYIIILGHGGNTSHYSSSGSCNETRQGKGKMPLTTKIYLISGRKLAVDFKEKQDPWMPFRLVNIQKFVDNDWKLTKWQEDNLRLNFPITNRRRKKIK